MKRVILITGSSGFLGRCVVDEALRRNHEVRAMIRPGRGAPWGEKPNLQVVRADLSSPPELPELLSGVDIVLHLAAAKTGDYATHQRDTVRATENLCGAMRQAGVRRLLLASSFSVYDYLSIPVGAVLTEESPLEPRLDRRDEYARAKLRQEQIVRNFAGSGGGDVTVIRPGAIYGRGQAWSPRLGIRLGRLWIRIGAHARLPLVYVEHAAEAMVLAAETPETIGKTINLVDDDPPTQRVFMAALARRSRPRPVVLPVPWTFVQGLARFVETMNHVLCHGRAPLPSILMPARLCARFKPLNYDNSAMKTIASYHPRLPLEHALDRSFGQSPPADTTLMRIAYLTGEYPRATDTFIQREVAALRQLGVEIQTFAVRRPHTREAGGAELKAERARTIYLIPCTLVSLLLSHLRILRISPRRYWSALRLALRTSSPGLKALAFQLYYFAEAGMLAEHIRRLGLTHVHNHFANSSCSVTMLAAEMGGFTFSFTMHGSAIFFEPKRWRIDEKIRRARFVACISYFSRSQGMIFAPVETWDRMHIVHCGIEPDRYIPATASGEGHRLLYVGRIAAVKGLPALLRALAIVRAGRPDVRLVVVGDGPDRAMLEGMARDMNIAECVAFLGYRSQEQLCGHLRETDVFVMSSFAEGVPVVLMEAMASTVPVVATRIAGVGELVEDGVSGFIVPPGDPDSLAEKIEMLLADGALRARFGAAGRARVVEQFDVRKEAAKLYQLLAEGHPGF